VAVVLRAMWVSIVWFVDRNIEWQVTTVRSASSAAVSEPFRDFSGGHFVISGNNTYLRPSALILWAPASLSIRDLSLSGTLCSNG